LCPEDLKSEWVSYDEIDEDHLFESLTNLDCHVTLHKFTMFMGTDTYNKFKNATVFLKNNKIL
jgi:hypothetical protein